MAVLPCLPRGHRRDFSPKREKSADPYAQSSRPSTSTSFRTVCKVYTAVTAVALLRRRSLAQVTQIECGRDDIVGGAGARWANRRRLYAESVIGLGRRRRSVLSRVHE